ncbi:hypothetical protein D0Z03_001517 [Geotrichum reessii]|nr:hypothetical protein D0Z03_001517 [Galactomyces reessii]
MANSETITLPNGKSYQQPTGLFINNEFVKSQDGKKFPVENPSTEKQIAEVYEAGEADVELAVEAAEAAFEDWGFGDSTHRGRLLNDLADKIEENAETLASIESLNNGKPLSLARIDVQLSADCIRNYGGWANKIYGDVVDSGSGYFNYIRREPIGVCGQVIPWNFPLLMFAWKIGPALAAGNTIVLKTAESTPLSALYAANLAKEVGFPPGVLNVLSGYGKTGQYITSHMRIKKIAFTGSTATGRHVMRAAAASNLKKVTLELGGKSPNIVFDDADLDKAVEFANLGIYFNSGEVCCAGSRIYVQEKIYDQFLQKLKVRAEKNVVGDPFDENTFQGPQTSKVQLDRILQYIEDGIQGGAKVITGGKRVDREGYFVHPTIFADVTEDMKIVKEEIFGPVVTITKFKDVQEVIKLANDTEYGLAAGIHTNDINKAIHVANKIRAGTIWVNTYNDFHHNVPFGGFNQSGIGRELGKEGIMEAYTQPKSVRIKLDI